MLPTSTYTDPRVTAGLAWSDIPTEFLRRELHKRQDLERPACGSKGGRGSYNTSLHVFALFLILGLSTAGKAPVIRPRER